MKKLFTLWTLALLALAAGAAADTAATAFHQLMEPYEGIRQALLHDTVDGVAEKAVAIREKAGETTAEDLEPLMTKVSDFAGQIAEASDIEGARQAFYELSKVMVQLRSKVAGEDLPVVVYCPMKKMSWLQPEGEIGNPYFGHAMAGCGQVVDK